MRRVDTKESRKLNVLEVNAQHPIGIRHVFIFVVTSIKYSKIRIHMYLRGKTLFYLLSIWAKLGKNWAKIGQKSLNRCNLSLILEVEKGTVRYILCHRRIHLN